VDDELHARENLQSILVEDCPSVEIVGMASTVDNAVLEIQESQPDVVFLDIRMSGSSGFRLLELVDEINFEVIFVTAYDNYAIKAIKFSALDYILKPIDPEELKAAIVKLGIKIKKDQKLKQLKLLHDNLSRQGIYEKIGIKSNDNLEFLSLKSIVHLQGESNYTRIYLENDQSFLVSKTLVEFEDLLNDLGFCRVHKTHLVNLSHVKSFNKSKSSHLILNENTRIPVSRRRKAELIKKLKLK
jgi:two-component system LytT family response regulator